MPTNTRHAQSVNFKSSCYDAVIQRDILHFSGKWGDDLRNKKPLFSVQNGDFLLVRIL